MEPELIPLATVMPSEWMVGLSSSSSSFSALVCSPHPHLVEIKGLVEEEVSCAPVGGDEPENMNLVEEGRSLSSDPDEVLMAFSGETVLSMHNPKKGWTIDAFL